MTDIAQPWVAPYVLTQTPSGLLVASSPLMPPPAVRPATEGQGVLQNILEAPEAECSLLGYPVVVSTFTVRPDWRSRPFERVFNSPSVN